jgi:hypothetical protein
MFWLYVFSHGLLLYHTSRWDVRIVLPAPCHGQRGDPSSDFDDGMVRAALVCCIYLFTSLTPTRITQADP